MRTSMSQLYTKSRQLAEIAFGKAQSQAVARERAVGEHDSIALARAEKTLRLREARLAREAMAMTAIVGKRG